MKLQMQFNNWAHFRCPINRSWFA